MRNVFHKHASIGKIDSFFLYQRVKSRLYTCLDSQVKLSFKSCNKRSKQYKVCKKIRKKLCFE